jgi:hypothetical protein
MVLQYHPQGLFEHVGNLWRAQGRRARLELKHFARHVMSESILNPGEVEGWRGEIHDGQVTKDNEQAQSEEAQARGGAEQRGRGTAEEPSPSREGDDERKPREGGDEVRRLRRGSEQPGRAGQSRSPRSREDGGDGDRRSGRTAPQRAAS